MTKTITGGCLCGAVKFSLRDKFREFYLCHCKQCRQFTGSAFASNIITAIDNIDWVSGQDKITIFDHPSRSFSKAFCESCGSALPFVNKSKTSLIVPAGSLNEWPEIKPQANIFVSEEATWLSDGIASEKFPGFS